MLDFLIFLQNVDWWSWIERIGSLIALIGLPYLVFDKLKRLPKFSFDFSGQSAKSFTRDGRKYFRMEFNGSIKNHSLDPNTIQKIYLVVWRNKARTDTKRFGYGAFSIKDSFENELKEPIMFAPRESKKLQIVFESILEGTADDKILSDLVPVFEGSNLLIHRDTYELAFEDVSGSLFDQRGVLLSRKLINLNWTVENTFRHLRDGNKWPFLKHVFKTRIEIFKLSLRKLLRSLGVAY